MNHPSQLRKFMKPGTVWTRVNHQYPDQVGGEVVTEKGTPVQVQVHRVDKDGIALELLGRPGTISYLSWPDPLYMWMTTEPNKITIENKYGPLLTYTRDMTEARSVIEAETPKGVFQRGLPRKWSVNFIKRSARPWEQAIYNIDAVSEEEAIEKGWARLQEQVPKRWRVFRLYSCNKV